MSGTPAAGSGRRCAPRHERRLDGAHQRAEAPASPAPAAGMSVWAQRLDGPIWARLRDPRTSGVDGVVPGLLACLLGLPPIAGRSVLGPVLVGVAAAMLGLWTATRGLRRLGWGAVVAGLLGLGLGILATRSSTGNLNIVFTASLIASMFVFSTPLVFGAIGGMFSERSGVVNIGLEGMMLMGAFWGVYGADKGGSWVVGLLVAMLAGGALALVHAFFAIHLRADQIVGGTAGDIRPPGVTAHFFFPLHPRGGPPPRASPISPPQIPRPHPRDILRPALRT